MAKTDRAWKIRPVVEALQETFKKGMDLGKWIAFDEMVIPSRSSRNTIRMYLKNKPHKYGTKLFAVYCGETRCCSRIQVEPCSRLTSPVTDHKSGAGAGSRYFTATYPRSFFTS